MSLIKEKIVRNCCLKISNALWEREIYAVSLPEVPHSNPRRENYKGMRAEDLADREKENDAILVVGFIVLLKSNWACIGFHVNNHFEQRRGKKRLVVDYCPLNKFLRDIQHLVPSKMI